MIEGSDRVFVLRDGRTVAELPQARASARRRHGGHGAWRRRPADGSAMAESADRPAAARCGADGAAVSATGARRAGAADRCSTSPSRRNFATLQTLNVNLTQVAHHRHRRRRHDAGDRHRRHRPVGRLADGDRRRAGAADLPGHAVPAAATSASASRWPSSCRCWSPALFGLFNGWLVTRFRIQPIIATLVLFIAGRGIAQVLTNGNLQIFKTAGVPVHRPRPRRSASRSRSSSWLVIVAAGRLDAAAHRLRPPDPGRRRQRGARRGWPACRSRGSSCAVYVHQRPAARASPG